MLKTTARNIWVFALVIVIGFSCSFSTAKIEDAQMAKDVKPDTKEPVNLTSSFESNAPALHCVVKVANAPSDTKIKARWIAVKAEGVEPNYQIAETESPVTSGYADFYLTKPDAGFPPGDYKVDLFLNPETIKDNKPTRTVTFVVKGSGAPTAGSSGAGGGAVAIKGIYFANDSEGKDVATEFSPASEIIYCFANISGAKAGTKVTARWIATQATGVEPNYLIASVDDTFKTEGNIFTSNLSRPTNGFPVGDYRVELYVNDSSTPAGTGTFKVVE